MKRTAAVLVTLLISGCGSIERFWNDEFVSVYAPDVLTNQQKNALAESLNRWLGQSKSERIRVAGPPKECATFGATEERCEWTSPWVATGKSGQSAVSSPDAQHVTFIYDRNQIARSWSYLGPLGHFTNADYQMKNSQQSLVKFIAAFSQGSIECQNEHHGRS